MKTCHLLAVAALFICCPTLVAAQPVVIGMGHAKDGDSLMVGETEVRLFGVDAPEFDQTCKRGAQNWACGSAAADKLAELVTGQDVECMSMGRDQHQRLLGRCRVRGVDVNRTLVSLGLAVAYRRYSADYVGDEASAKAAKLGIWAGSFDAPEEYRRTGGVSLGVTAGVQHQVRSAGTCLIKGNRNRKGQWIYHLPGMPYYEATRAEEMFCSENQARAAGYRRAIVK